MEFDSFKSYVDDGADFRPLLCKVVKRYVELEGGKKDDFRGPAWQLFREVERKVGPEAPGIKFPQTCLSSTSQDAALQPVSVDIRWDSKRHGNLKVGWAGRSANARFHNLSKL